MLTERIVKKERKVQGRDWQRERQDVAESKRGEEEARSREKERDKWSEKRKRSMYCISDSGAVIV